MKIAHITAHEILASGGYPTVQAEITLEDGSSGRASVPYGASAGTHEAAVLTDQETDRYLGQGMRSVVETIHTTIAPKLIGLDADNQREIDQTMIKLDGTANKSKFGGNAILAVSVATARAAASSHQRELYDHLATTFTTNPDYTHLPQPMMVVIEGGKHADDTTDLQEFCLVPVKESSPTENIRQILETYHHLKKVLKGHRLSTNVGNEGAFAPNGIPSNEAPFEYMLEAIKAAGYEPGVDVGIAIDAAASEFYQDGKYHLSLESKALSATELIAYYETWFQKYPLITVEDLLDEDDWDNWVTLNQAAQKHGITLIGDDLTVTNQDRLQKAIDLKAISAILIKLNQIGSVTETIDTCLLAKKHGLMTVPSHRGGGETNDTAMVDVAVAVGSRFIKVGPTRGERVEKYNRLMEIERQISPKG